MSRSSHQGQGHRSKNGIYKRNAHSQVVRLLLTDSLVIGLFLTILYSICVQLVHSYKRRIRLASTTLS